MHNDTAKQSCISYFILYVQRTCLLDTWVQVNEYIHVYMDEAELLMTTGECFFWYRLTRVAPDKIQRAVNGCVCVCVCVYTHIRTANSRSTNWNPAPPPQKKTKILVRAYSLTSLHNYTIPAEGFTDLFPNPNPNIHRIQRKPRPTEPPPLPDTKPSRPRDERHLLYGCDKLRQAGSVRNHRPGWMTENKPSDA